MSLKCPKCNLYSPDNAIKCDCGYDFRNRNDENKRDNKEKLIKQDYLKSYYKIKEKIKTFTQVSFILFTILITLLSASDLGFMIRGEVTTDFNIRHIFFYLTFFCIPFLFLYGFLHIVYWGNEKYKKYYNNYSSLFTNLSIFLISFACFITSIFLLKSIVAFIKNIPFDIWRGDMFLLWLILTLLLLFFGILGIKVQIETIQMDKEIEIAKETKIYYEEMYMNDNEDDI